MSYIAQGRTFKVFITVDISGDLPTIVPDISEEKLKDNPNLKREWAEFLHWDWGTMVQILQESRIPVETGDYHIDPLKLRESKLKYLLVDWSLTDEKGQKITLTRTGNTLTAESLNKVRSVNAGIISAFLMKADFVLELGRKEEDFFTKSTPDTSTSSTPGKQQ